MASHSEQVRVWTPSRALMPVSSMRPRILAPRGRRSGDPARDGCAVVAVGIAEARLERRLLVERDEEMEAREDGRGVDEQAAAPEPERVTEQDRHDAHVHRVPHPSIQTLCNELLRRIDGCERAAATHREVAHAPEQDGGAGELERRSEEVERAD